ncbi:hypothetical protein CMALT430_40008 [Carnobacterium maltaromaticum]|nr:hypothetical protein CMALT430_40008 [Carnobacterium maltaromaticum]
MLLGSLFSFYWGNLEGINLGQRRNKQWEENWPLIMMSMLLK